MLGADKAACFDVSAACSGFLYGIEVAQQFISNHTYNTVLVIGADKLSSIVNWNDRNTCVLFGDGAGAAVLRWRAGSHGVITTFMGSDGNFAEILHMPGGGCAIPVTKENFDQRLNTLHMNGRETFKQAVTSMLAAANRALKQSGLAVDDLTCIIPHQANLRIIEALAGRLERSSLEISGESRSLRQHLRGRRRYRAGRRESHRPIQGRRLHSDGCIRRGAYLRQFGGAVVGESPPRLCGPRVTAL